MNGIILILYSIIIGASLFLENTYILITSFTLLLIIYILFFKKNSMNFIFWGIFMQWLSLSVEPIYASLKNQNLHYFFSQYSSVYINTNNIENAFLLNALGILFYSIGIYKFSTFHQMPLSNLLKNSSVIFSFKKYTIFYVFYSVFTLVLNIFLFWEPRLTQFFSFFILLKWGFYFVFSLYSFYDFKKRKHIFFVVSIIELAQGFGSYFASSISNVILFAIFARIASIKKISFKNVLFSSTILVLVLNFGILWSAVKGDYRNFLTGGERSQLVVVDRAAGIQKLIDLSNNLTIENYYKGADKLVARIGYFSFISKVLDYVPRVQPHENGKILYESFSFYFIPRFIDPDKPVIDDSAHSSKYLGVRLAGAKEGTSISLGYVADAYVDFGIPLMFISILFLGLFTGLAYKSLLSISNPFWTPIIGSLFYFLTNINGLNTIKIVGPILITMFFGFMFLKFLAPKFQRYFFENKNTSR